MDSGTEITLPTPRQQDVLAALAALTARDGYPPTIRGLGRHLDLAAPTVFKHLAELERKGFIERSPDGRRLIRLTPNPRSTR